MATPETGYNREQIKGDLQALEQKIARMEADPNADKEELGFLHNRYDTMRSNFDDLDKAA